MRNLTTPLIIAAVLAFGLFFYYLAFGGRGGEQASKEATEEESAKEQPTPTPSEPEPDMKIILSPSFGSGIGGVAKIFKDGDKTKVLITTAFVPQGANHPAHIHMGECPKPGEISYPLENVVDGKSETLLDVSLDKLKSETLAINLHNSPSELEQYIACGNLK